MRTLIISLAALSFGFAVFRTRLRFGGELELLGGLGFGSGVGGLDRPHDHP